MVKPELLVVTMCEIESRRRAQPGGGFSLWCGRSLPAAVRLATAGRANRSTITPTRAPA